MTASYHRDRLDGLEPDNLLAFFALLGLLRALEAAQPPGGRAPLGISPRRRSARCWP